MDPVEDDQLEPVKVEPDEDDQLEPVKVELVEDDQLEPVKVEVKARRCSQVEPVKVKVQPGGSGEGEGEGKKLRQAHGGMLEWTNGERECIMLEQASQATSCSRIGWLHFEIFHNTEEKVKTAFDTLMADVGWRWHHSKGYIGVTELPLHRLHRLGDGSRRHTWQYMSLICFAPREISKQLEINMISYARKTYPGLLTNYAHGGQRIVLNPTYGGLFLYFCHNFRFSHSGNSCRPNSPVDLPCDCQNCVDFDRLYA